MKLKKKFVLAALLILILTISACSLTGKKGASTSSKSKKAVEDIRIGTQGIIVSFLSNAPPDKIVVEPGLEDIKNSFEVVLDVRNKGAYPQPEDRVPAPVNAKVYLSGYDGNVIYFKKLPSDQVSNLEDLSNKPLDGKSTINPNGGQDLITFRGFVNVGNLNVDKYEPTLQAIACYQYWTIAGPSVCIDPDPYSTTGQKKVCEPQSITLSSQGAPVAITKIDEEAFATKTQFRITLKNVGGGDVIKDTSLDKCSPSGEKVGREDIDKIYVINVKVGNKDLLCGPFVDRPGQYPDVREKAGYIRMLNGEGYIICELQSSDYSSTKSAYTTPINVHLQYGYRSSIEKKLLIKRETGGSLGSSSSAATSTQNQIAQSGSDEQGNPLFT